MTMASEIDQIDFSVDTGKLYREENYTDLSMASIRKLIPVKADGSDDPSRQTLFTGYTQLMTPAGALPVNCIMKSNNMKDALKEYPGAMKEALELLVKELQQQQMDANRIVVPGETERKIIY